MFKSIVAATAVFASALFAHGANVSSVTKQMGTLDGSASPYTAASLVYKTANQASSGCNRSVEGWYAGLKLSWTKNKQKTSDTSVSVSDNADSINEISYKASDYTSDNRAPDNSGMKNTITTYWFTPYMETTEWYVCITPEILYSLGETDYSATLNIGGNTYTITVPQTVELFDGDGVQWYPAKAVVDGKVYGDMGLAVEAGATAAAAGKDMAFFEEPTGCPEGVSVEKDGNVWKLVVSGPTSIESVDITLSKTEPITFDGKEHSVDVTAVMLGDVVLSRDVDYSVSGDLSATERGEYTVTVTGTGNFTGSATAEWSIVNTTGSLSGVTSAVSGIGDYDSENNTLTVTDSTALEYSDGAWYAGLTLTWPMTALNVSLNPLRDGSADYVKPEKMQLTIDGNVYTGSEILSSEAVYSAGKLAAKVSTDTYKYYESLISQPTKQFEYLATTTWKVAVTPAIIEAALANDEDELVYTMNAGAFVWEDGREGDSDGVAFADYTITLPLDEPVEFVLGEGEAYDLGDTELTTTKIQLAAGACVTCDVVQAEGLIYTEVNGYDVVCSEDGGKYVYTAILTHVHDWSASVAENGYELVATCENDECDINAGVVKMWLDVGTTEKPYDGNSVTRFAVYGDGFKTVYPDSTNVVLTVNGVKDGVIKNAGEYDVELTVNGVGEETYTLSRKVTISKVDITGATLVLSPATTPYNGTEQTVAPSVNANGLAATFEVDTETSTTAATEMGTYTVTVNGTGNFTGSATATWSIVNTTGTPTSVAASAAGSMTNVGNDFTLSDSSKLEYDAENEVWYAGITIAWPMSKTDYAWYVLYTRQGSAKYVKEESAKITTVDGFTTNVMETASYKTGSNASKDFTYVSTTTWKVPLTPAIIEAAIAEEKASLTYTMNAGAFIWGDDTEGDPDGVAFTDYTITIPLEGIKLYDGDGNQVYPKPEGQTIIEDIKDDIGDVVSDAEVAEGAKAKIDLLAGVAGEGKEQSVAEWVDSMKGDDAATFYAELAQSEYVEASFGLGTTSLISDASDVEVAEFESTDGGFTLAVTIDDKNIDAERIQQLASIIWSATSLGGEIEFAPLVPGRISVEGGKVIVSKDANADCEFFKIMISKDSAE